MGACASKPKGLKADAGAPPVPEPAPVKEEEVVTVSEAKGEIVEEEEKKVEVVDDEQANKRQSLSLLFKENEEGKDSTEDDKKPSEPTKEEPSKTEEAKDSIKDNEQPSETAKAEPSKTEKASEESEVTAPEAEKSAILIEQNPTPDVIDAPKTEEVVEAAPSNETQEMKIEEEKKGSAAENVIV